MSQNYAFEKQFEKNTLVLSTISCKTTLLLPLCFKIKFNTNLHCKFRELDNTSHPIRAGKVGGGGGAGWWRVNFHIYSQSTTWSSGDRQPAERNCRPPGAAGYSIGTTAGMTSLAVSGAAAAGAVLGST